MDSIPVLAQKYDNAPKDDIAPKDKKKKRHRSSSSSSGSSSDSSRSSTSRRKRKKKNRKSRGKSEKTSDKKSSRSPSSGKTVPEVIEIPDDPPLNPFVTYPVEPRPVSRVESELAKTSLEPIPLGEDTLAVKR